jgi:hypothetical protein
MPNKPIVHVYTAQAAIKSIVTQSMPQAIAHAVSVLHGARLALVASAMLALAGCTQIPKAPPPPQYRCELGIEFTAKFIDETVALDGSRGYDVLFRSAKGAAQAGNANFYSNPRMEVEFNQGSGGREATLRYPLLPLAVRCVRD